MCEWCGDAVAGTMAPASASTAPRRRANLQARRELRGARRALRQTPRGQRARAAAGDAAASSAEEELRAALERRRRIRTLGTAFSGTVLAGAAGAALAGGLLEPPPPAALGLATAAAAGIAALLDVEAADGRLYFQSRLPGTVLDLPKGGVAVRETGDARGRGAFAAVRLPAGTWLGDYEGELLDTATFLTRYPDEDAEYCIAVDATHVVDGAAAAEDASRFTPAHMNHARGDGANVARWHRRAERRVAFYTSRDVEAGEELLLDYGRDFWRNREELEL